MQELRKKWSTAWDLYDARLVIQYQYDDESNNTYKASHFASCALMISDESESGRNLGENITRKENTNGLFPNGKKPKWNVIMKNRNHLIRGLRDLAAYYDHLARTGEHVFTKSPDEDVGSNRGPSEKIHMIPEDRAVGRKACDDVCGQLVHHIMSIVDR